MKTNNSSILILIFLFSFFQISCNNSNQDKLAPTKQKHKKPVASNSDTLVINEVAAVFYQPDSLQLIKIKAANPTNIFKSIEHELFFQMRNARIVIKTSYPSVKIIETNHSRFLKFKTTSNKEYLFDLDEYNDMSGIILFNKKDKPLITDMMNIDTDLGFYFKKILVLR